jgi:hypothetical protein
VSVLVSPYSWCTCRCCSRMPGSCIASVAVAPFWALHVPCLRLQSNENQWQVTSGISISVLYICTMYFRRFHMYCFCICITNLDCYYLLGRDFVTDNIYAMFLMDLFSVCLWLFGSTPQSLRSEISDSTLSSHLFSNPNGGCIW